MGAKPHLTAKWKMSAAAHHGASYTERDVAGWTPRVLSADAEILPDLSALVGRAGDLDRNNGIAAGGFQTLVDNVVGTGLRLSARPNYRALGWTKERADEWSREVEWKFHAWFWSTDCHAGDTLTGDQLTSQLFRSVIARGGAVALPLWLPDRGPYATRIQTVEVDRLSQPEGAMQTTRFRGGIEFDQYGAPTHYHFRTTHPGEVFLDAVSDYARWERVPRKTGWGRMRVLHVFDAQRPGQTRGKPLLSAVLPQFKNVDRYVQAELQAALVNALVAMTITTPMDQDSILELFNKDHKAYLQARQEHAGVRLSSGGILPLFPGDKAEAFMPSRPAAAFDQFVKTLHRLIASGGFGLPYELVMKDFSTLNYAAIRGVILEAWRSILRWRDWLSTTWLDPLYYLWAEEAASKGEIEAPDFYRLRNAYLRCRWVGPGRGWVDPVKEATAAKMRIEIGISTLEDECAEQGRDWRESLEQQAIERAERERLGLPQPGDAPAPAAAENNRAEPVPQPPDDDEMDEDNDPRDRTAAAAGRAQG